jgi:hypothetical protein
MYCVPLWHERIQALNRVGDCLLVAASLCLIQLAQDFFKKTVRLPAPAGIFCELPGELLYQLLLLGIVFHRMPSFLPICMLVARENRSAAQHFFADCRRP